MHGIVVPMPTLQEQPEAFEATPPEDLAGDPIWRLPACRIALFLSQLVADDLRELAQRAVQSHVPAQLERFVDSIGVNIAEGYSRYSGNERARYYEIALGSAREARELYRRCGRWLGTDGTRERGLLLTRVIGILSSAVPRERAGESEARIARAHEATRRRKVVRPAPPAAQGSQSADQ